MTIDALHGTVDRPLDPSTGGAAIGAPDANIFLCPRCTRPLAVGVSRCAGCKTRLVAGVPLLKVSGFVGLGMIAGLAIVGGIVGALTLAGRGTSTAAVAPPAAVPSAVPVGSGLAVTSAAPLPSIVPVDPAVPAPALTALRRSTTVNSAPPGRCRPARAGAGRARSVTGGHRAPTAQPRSHRVVRRRHRVHSRDVGPSGRPVGRPRVVLRVDRSHRPGRVDGVDHQ